MVTEIELFESTNLIEVRFYLWGWMGSEFFNRKGGYTKRTAC